MSDFNYVFKRTEQKYMLNTLQYMEIRERLNPYTEEDQYGLSTICNIYYDTPDFELIRRSLAKPKYKEKLRLRSYGIPAAEDSVFVEIKKKFDGVVYKRRVAMPFLQAEDYLNNGERPHVCSQIMKEINYFMDFYKPLPAVYLAYDRQACYAKEDNDVRITFDSNIRSRQYDLDFSCGDYGEAVLESGMYLMEIKIAGAMPMWLVNILSGMGAYPTSFSKYGSVYANSVCNGSGVRQGATSISA